MNQPTIKRLYKLWLDGDPINVLAEVAHIPYATLRQALVKYDKKVNKKNKENK